ncbi:N-acetylgalactosaminyltransferase 6-like [Chironomus tepperi]|uniref:N-acetylgalactosaminyltransferase 6-like n=1 Tax=Chironomus tepperi TaxID=113505 RepID=UPI00391F961E
MSVRRLFVKINFVFRQALKHKRPAFQFLFCLLVLTIVSTTILIKLNNDPLAIQKPYIYIEPLTSYYRFKHAPMTKDWHDYNFIEYEGTRIGPGENGTPVFLPPDEQELATKIFLENKHNGLVSDKIARDRSLPDTRPPECKTKQYLTDLPQVSVIIPFHNEILSTLTRTIHSVFNRSPPELLKEVILVNDHSDKDYCYEPLETYIAEHFDVNKIRILVLGTRSGLMWARLAGARAASGDVLIFMDCHTEANINWLPPLIEPIAKDYRTCVCPYIDVINAKDYHYSAIFEGTRGVFNWHFFYQFLPLRPQDKLDPAEPFETPVMMGCVFAISAKFFWELGGYDSALEIWGGEQYELSFKVWLCHGKQLDAPCSRVGHLYRPRPFTNAGNHSNYVHYNYKRVAEIWMDEYANYLYKRDPELWNSIDVGDTSYMKGIKKKLKCKNFSYFLHHVAPDMLHRFPYIEPPEFASGAIISVANPKYCVDALSDEREMQVGIYPCKENLQKPGYRQNFKLRNHRDISIEGSNSNCLDFNLNKILIYSCKFKQDNQYFRYDMKTQQIYCGSKWKNWCMEVDMRTKMLIYATCNSEKATQKWNWGFVNETMLNDWINNGEPIMDEQEILDLKKEYEKL